MKMKIFWFILFCLMLYACSHVEVIKGTETEKIKLNVLASENCKVRIKLNKQKLKCKWEF